MKKLLVIIILSLCFMTSSKADDIKDFQIEGISVGDSLLDHFSKSEIQNASKIVKPYLHQNEYIEQSIPKISKTYDRIKFSWLQKDEKYILHGVSGITIYKDNFNGCLETKKQVARELQEMFPDLKKNDRNKIFSSYDPKRKSYRDETSFKFKDGSAVRVYCSYWSKELQKKNKWYHSLHVNINDVKFLNYLSKTYNSKNK